MYTTLLAVPPNVNEMLSLIVVIGPTVMYCASVVVKLLAVIEPLPKTVVVGRRRRKREIYMGQIKRKNRGVERLPVARPSLDAVPNWTTQSAALENSEIAALAMREALVAEVSQPKAPAKVNLSDEEAALLAGCKTNVRQVVQRLLDANAHVTFETSQTIDGSHIWTIDAVRAILLAEAPDDPIQSMLVNANDSFTLASNEIRCQGRRSRFQRK
jgi:hypothetical protein